MIMAASKKKTSKKSSKTDAPVGAKKGSESPLLAAIGTLDKVLKASDWRTDLNPEMLSKPLPHFPTGSFVIDLLIGGKPNAKGVSPCPGMPRGKIMQLYGHEGSGKTTLALTMAASIIEAGGTCCYIDWENEIVPYYAKALGVPIEDKTKFILAQPETLEQGMAIAYAMAKHGVDLVVFDSVGAGVPKKFLEGDAAEIGDLGRVGLNAALWSKYLPILKGVSNRTGTAVVGVSQIRDAINTMGHGDNSTVQGGRGWKFYSALRLKLQRIAQEKASEMGILSNSKEDRIVGAVIKAKLDKCKVSPQQGNEEKLYIRHGEGIDDYRTLLEVGIAHNVVKKSGSWFEWVDPASGTSVRCQGMDTFRKKMVTTEKAMDTLLQQIMPFLAATVTEVEEEDEGDGETHDLDMDDFELMLSGDKSPAAEG